MEAGNRPARLGGNPIGTHYLAHRLWRRGVPLLPTLLEAFLFIVWNVRLPYQTQVGQGCTIAHGGVGIVVHPDAQIGRDVILCQQVTIGGTGTRQGAPVIGDGVYLGAGAKVLGPVEIGSHCIIGANAVVVHDIPSRCIAAGVPARIIRSGVVAQSHLKES